MHTLSLGCTPDAAQVLKLRKNWIDGNSFFSCSITTILCTIPDATAREKRRSNLDTPDATKIFPLQQKARKQTHKQEANKQITRPFSHSCLYNPTCLPQQHDPRLFH
jgi:hypothetical protein